MGQREGAAKIKKRPPSSTDGEAPNARFHSPVSLKKANIAAQTGDIAPHTPGRTFPALPVTLLTADGSLSLSGWEQVLFPFIVINDTILSVLSGDVKKFAGKRNTFSCLNMGVCAMMEKIWTGEENDESGNVGAKTV